MTQTAKKTLTVRLRPELYDRVKNLSGNRGMTDFVDMALDIAATRIEKTLTPN